LKPAKYWSILLAVSLALAILGCFRADAWHGARALIYPLENGVAWVRHHAWTPIRRALSRAEAAPQTRELEAEVERLRLDAVRLESVAVENRRLRQALEFPAPPGNHVVACPVLSQGGTTGWQRQVRIGRGTHDGLRPGDPVLVADGLVGRVDRVTERMADVLLISDPNSRIACELDPPPVGMDAVRGLLCGGGGHAAGPGALTLLYVMDPLRLRFIKRDAEPAPRSRVVTSGLGGVFPRGLPVGFILDSTAEPNSLYREADVMPAADLDALEIVFVLTRPASEGGAAP